MYKIYVNEQNIRDFSLLQVSTDPASATALKALKQYLKPHSGSAEGRILVGVVSDIPALSDRLSDVEEEGILIRISGTDIYIAGGSGRGVIYAAYEFLERFCGWRFFTPELETHPHGIVHLKDSEYFFNPPFDYRMNLIPGAGEGTDLFQKRHLNAKWGPMPLPAELGGSVVFATDNAHTFQELLPDSVYFDEHPEYFAMNEEGERIRDTVNGTQPCLTNPDVFDIVLENLRKILKENPKARFASVSQNDGDLFCHCDACRRVNEEEQTNGGTIYRFVNRIAAALRDEYPDMLFDTLPYVFSTKPPEKEVMADNVSIRLCLMSTCREHAVKDESCPYNEKIRNYFRDWTKCCSNIYLWDYTANFKNYPISVPNFKLLYQNMQRYLCFPVKGVMYQGSHTTDPDIEFGGLWAYLQSKLLWNPHMSYGEYLTCTKEFMQACYGEGWQYLYDYLMLTMMQPSSDYHYGPSATCEQIIPMLTLPDGSPDMTFIRDANQLFDFAEQAASGEALEHVRRTRLHLTWYELCTTYGYIRTNGTPEQISELKEKYESFFHAVNRWEHFSLTESEKGRIYDVAFDFEKNPNELIEGAL